jgi:hypothetical protein
MNFIEAAMSWLDENKKISSRNFQLCVLNVYGMESIEGTVCASVVCVISGDIKNRR